MDVVTGAYGFLGKYITKKLLQIGHDVNTLTNSPDRESPFGDRVNPIPFNFDNTLKLKKSLEGISVLYNTYWVRFNHPPYFTFKKAVENSKILFEAAKKAGVKRIVHVSITNPSLDSPLEYFRGKAILEKLLMESGISYAILRPAVIFGKEDILINNIAWFLRKFPIFGVFGDGMYKLQPIYVKDFAELAVELGNKSENVIIDVIGPEIFSYRDLVKTIGEIIGKKRPIVSISPKFGYLVGYISGKIIGDVIITKDEIKGLMSNLLYTDSNPTGKKKLTEYLMENRETVGLRYRSELKRRMNREASYENL